MIRNWYNQIPYHALKTKREVIKYINWQQFTKGEPKNKYWQQEQATVRNHNAALKRPVLKLAFYQNI